MSGAAPAYRPSHLGLCVSDLDASRRFYCDGLGFSPAEGFELTSAELDGLADSLEVDGPVSLTSQFVTLGDLKVELLAFRDPAVGGQPSWRRNQRGLTHLSFYVDDVDAAARHLTQFGGTVLDETRSNLGVDVVFLADPDGVRVELMALAPSAAAS
jgi:catechol 2,3-dioxygenase-like lactoylglutathione lyase family enzyme